MAQEDFHSQDELDLAFEGVFNRSPKPEERVRIDKIARACDVDYNDPTFSVLLVALSSDIVLREENELIREALSITSEELVSAKELIEAQANELKTLREEFKAESEQRFEDLKKTLIERLDQTDDKMDKTVDVLTHEVREAVKEANNGNLNYAQAYQAIVGNEIPPETMALCQQIEATFGVSDRNVMFSVMLLLGYHMQLYKEMPERIRFVREDLVESVKEAFAEIGGEQSQEIGKKVGNAVLNYLKKHPEVVLDVKSQNSEEVAKAPEPEKVFDSFGNMVMKVAKGVFFAGLIAGAGVIAWKVYPMFSDKDFQQKANQAMERVIHEK